MMCNVKMISSGGAANKAGVEVVERGVLSQEQILLINSTLRDVPDNYRSLAVKYNDSIGGCGKDMSLSAELCLKSIKDGDLGKRLDGFFDPSDELVIVQSSSEGGTGAGSSKILAKYVNEVIGLPVLCFPFLGFFDDSRGISNTVEYFQNISSDYVVQSICNNKFLNDSINKIKAEKLANAELAKRLRILMGSDLVDSEQNIDETDLYKVITTPGYMISDKIELNKIKNIDQFNKAVIEMLDNSKSLETEKSVKRLAVFLNVSEQTREYVDYKFSVLKERLGTPYELYSHIQYDPDQSEYVSFIASGMKLPIGEIQEIYQKYKEESEKVDKKKDDFFSIASSLKGNEEDSMFNVRRRSIQDNSNKKDSFFNEFKAKEINEANKTIDVSKVVEDTKKEIKTKQEFLKENF